MAESNLKDALLDDVNEENDEDTTFIESQPKLKWYLIDTEKTFCKVWNFLITILTIYTLSVSPFILTFRSVYLICEGQDCLNGEDQYNETLRNIEQGIDIFMLIEIFLNFVKKKNIQKDLTTIGYNYITGYFIWDLIATLPGLMTGEIMDFYFLKLFRIMHFTKLTQPLNLFLSCLLSKYSKKRQNDLTNFAGLILYVIYLSHIMACTWL